MVITRKVDAKKNCPVPNASRKDTQFARQRSRLFNSGSSASETAAPRVSISFGSLDAAGRQTQNLQFEDSFFKLQVLRYHRAMIERNITPVLRQLASQYPVITLTGPRQSGKTTLARSLFADKPYLSLEDPDTRRYAADDPRGFLAQYTQGAVLDEIQRAACRRPGKYLN